MLVLAILSACVPKPEEISGCKTGTSFSDVTLTCVNSTPAITYGSVFNALTVNEDVPEPFSMPTASSSDVPGEFYYFISTEPALGIITDCADRDVSGNASGVGTTDNTCTYTPDANVAGSDSFEYRVCNTVNGASRCGTPIAVSVTVNTVNDPPVLIAPATVTVAEGNNLIIDLRVARRGVDEADDIYVCLSPDATLAAALTGERGNDLTTAPPTTFAVNTCALVSNEADNLANPIASFTGAASLLPDDFDDLGNLTVQLCEDAGCVGPSTTQIIPVTVQARNFAPTFALASPQTLTPPTVVEGSAVYTIGTNVASFQDLPLVTDPDGDSFTYHYTANSLTPTTAGTLACTDGADLACTFTPSADYVGNVSFSYTARDDNVPAAQSTSMTVTWAMSGVNDPPVFKTTSQVYALSVTPSALVENTALSRSLLVSEGGGADENSEILTLSATSTDPTVMPLANIQVYRGAVLLGDLSAPLVLDGSGVDADAQSYTMVFTPPTNVVTDNDTLITLSLNDGSVSTPLAITFTGITNVNNNPSFPTAPPGLFGMQFGTTKGLVFRATPGAGDWVTVAGASQDLVVTVTSTTPTVVDASALTLSLSGAVATVTKRVGADCTASSCIFDLDYTGTDDPADDDITLNVVPGVRGTSNLAISISDGLSSTSRSVSASVYNFAVSFNGWSKLKATGPVTYNSTHVARATDPASLTVGWNPLTVTEGGVPTSLYTVRVYRQATAVYAPAAGDALDNDGASAIANEATFVNSAPFDDATTLTAGSRFYLILAVTPIPISDYVMTPASAADSLIQVVVPPDNMALVHRWMANKEFCERSGQSVDRANDYRCLNNGLGAVEIAGTHYYDQLVHLMADRFEAGCPFDLRDDGSAALTDDGVTISDATVEVGRTHYNRLAQLCTHASGGTWQAIEDVALPSSVKLNEGQLPPLVNITASDAETMCGNQDIYCDGVVCGGIFAAASRELPTRREMYAASAWPATSPSADTISVLEDSGDHSKFACNTNSANGLAFVDLAPGILVSDTFPNSLLSTTRTLTNSAAATNFCESRYGLKNSIGNVSELLADQFDCNETVAPNVACDLLAPLGSTATGLRLRDDSVAANNWLNIVYELSGTPGLGPVLDSSSAESLAVINLMTSNADRYHQGLGFPFLEDAGVPHPQAGLPRYIAAGSGANVINNLQLSNDGIKLFFTTLGTYSLSHGGSATSLTAAGRNSAALRRVDAVSSQTGFRCVVRLSP